MDRRITQTHTHTSSTVPAATLSTMYGMVHLVVESVGGSMNEKSNCKVVSVGNHTFARGKPRRSTYQRNKCSANCYLNQT